MPSRPSMQEALQPALTCGPCPEPLEAVLPRCSHTQKVRCGDDLEKVLCLEKCTKTRSCGHACLLLCGVDCSDPKHVCLAQVAKKLPCGHHTKVPCHASASVPECKEPCTKMLDCGHQCTGNCNTCDGDRLHQACTRQDCSRPLVRKTVYIYLIVFCRSVATSARNLAVDPASVGTPARLPAHTAAVQSAVESLATRARFS